MYIEIQVETPVNLNRDQRKTKEFEILFQNTQNHGGKSTNLESEGFFRGAREALG